MTEYGVLSTVGLLFKLGLVFGRDTKFRVRVFYFCTEPNSINPHSVLYFCITIEQYSMYQRRRMSRETRRFYGSLLTPKLRIAVRSIGLTGGA